MTTFALRRLRSSTLILLPALVAAGLLACAPPKPASPSGRGRAEGREGLGGPATVVPGRALPDGELGNPMGLGAAPRAAARDRADGPGKILGRIVPCYRYTKRRGETLGIRPDPRARLIIPVNVLRIYSPEHSADKIATRAYIHTQIEVTNRLFRYSDRRMAAYGRGRLAPVIQFKLNRIYDVHERQFSKVLGFDMDTESLMMRGKSYNGRRLANTWDVRSVKIKGETTYLHIYYAWSGRSGHKTGRWGGVSNLGFAELATPPSHGLLTKVTGSRAYMGPILFRLATPSTMAHEIGHYFDLPHAWQRVDNSRRSIGDLGEGPKTNVDQKRGHDNVMDYGRDRHQYFTHHQIQHMYTYALRKAPMLLTVHKGSGILDTSLRPTPRPAIPRIVTPRPMPRPVIPTPTHPTPTVSATAQIDKIWIESAVPGGKVVIHSRFSTAHVPGEGTIVAWFRDRRGQTLRDADGRFRTRSGKVALQGRFVARSTRASFADHRLTLPAGQLHLPPGRHELSVVVGLFHGGRLLSRSRPEPFNYSVPERPKALTTSGRAAAWIQKTEVKPAFVHGGKQQVKILVNVALDHLKGQNVQLEARFYFTDGRVLKDFDRRFRSAEGHAMVVKKLTPSYTRSRWKNVKIKMPYAELHLPANRKVTLRAGLTVISGGKTLASGHTASFVVDTSPRTATHKPPPRRVTAASAEIKRTTITQGIRRGGKLGMLVKTRLTVRGYRSKPLTFVAWFYDRGGRALRDRDRAYSTRSGKVASSVTIKPIYDSATFPSCTVFIPYDQLHQRPGRHRLMVSVAVLDGGRFLATSAAKHRFEVTIGGRRRAPVRKPGPRNPTQGDPFDW